MEAKIKYDNYQVLENGLDVIELASSYLALDYGLCEDKPKESGDRVVLYTNPDKYVATLGNSHLYNIKYVEIKRFYVMDENYITLEFKDSKQNKIMSSVICENSDINLDIYIIYDRLNVYKQEK